MRPFFWVMNQTHGRKPARDGSEWACSLQAYEVHDAPLGVVRNRKMLRAPIVVEHEIACLPTNAALHGGIMCLGVELREDCFALLVRYAHEM